MLDLENKRILALNSLGLTRTQAKVYIANLKAGRATAKTISKFAGIGREEVYRVLPALLALGLITRIIITPSMYEAILPKNAITILLRNKEEELSKVRAQMNEFLESFQENEVNSEIIENNEMIMISNREKHINFMKAAIDRTEHSLHVVGNLKIFGDKFEILGKSTCEALHRGVEMQIVRGSPTEGFQIPKTLLQLYKKKSVGVRYVSAPPECGVAIYDDKRCFILGKYWKGNQNRIVNPKDGFALWTDNPVIVTLRGVHNSFFIVSMLNEAVSGAGLTRGIAKIAQS